MNRKWTVLAAAMLSTALVVSGIAVAQDEELSPLGKVMEDVQANHVKILKSYRTPVAWAKGQKDAADAAQKLVELGKKAKPLGGDAIKEMKKTQQEWDDKMDAFLKEAEEFAKIAGKADTKNTVAKKAYSKVSASCTSCHNDFRAEE